MALIATGLSTHIANNHFRSALLLAGFPLLLAALVYAFFAGLAAFSQPPGYPVNWQAAGAVGWQSVLAYGHWVLIAAGVWFVVAYLFHGSMMRAATGAQPITRAQMPKIYNMLENLCIAQGVAMPSFEIIDSPALNAFASGINEKTYKIVLTRGIIERLSDDELEAVIAHELTHIINRDVRLLIISVIFVGMIGFLAETIFRLMVYGRSPAMYGGGRRDGKGGGGAIMLLALAVLVVGYIFSILIRFALSRRREYLADAGAVEMTKNPEGMMRALQRISGQDQVKGMPDDVQMMCIENSHRFMGMFATHPPIPRRIQAISQMTGTPVPEAGVSLRRGPRRPWDRPLA